MKLVHVRPFPQWWRFMTENHVSTATLLSEWILRVAHWHCVHITSQVRWPAGPTWAYPSNTDVRLCKLSEGWRLTRREVELERLRWQGSLSPCLSARPPGASQNSGGPLLEAAAHMTQACSLLSSVRHTLLLRQVYKTFNCKLFYAGDNP